MPEYNYSEDDFVQCGEGLYELICPFCKAPVKVWETAFGVVSVVECKTCQSRFVFPWHRKGKELFDFWNRRVNNEHE